MVDLGARIRMDSPSSGVAISRGMGKDVKGKAYRIRNGQWSPFFDYPYSDYPLIAQRDPSTVWTVTHLTHEGAYRPVFNSFQNEQRRELPLPTVMWDEIDHVMFKGIAVTGPSTAWLVGQQGHILRFENERWREVESPLIHKQRVNVYDGDLNDIAMTDDRNGWAVGRNGIIIRCDAGVWTRVESPSSQTLNKIALVNDSTGWAVGNNGTLLQLSRRKWSAVTLDLHDQLSSVFVLDAQHAWAVGNNSTLLAYDGTSWSLDPSIRMYDDYFADISVVRDSANVLHHWIIGNQGIYTTSQSLGFSFTDITADAGLGRIGKLGHFLTASSSQLPKLLIANDGGSGTLYNIEGNRFANVTSGTPFALSPKDAVVMATGDVNNDGVDDVLQMVDAQRWQLIISTPLGGYRDLSRRSGLAFDPVDPLTAIALRFVDLDNDGNLDLYLSNCDLPDQIFLGDGSGKFRRWTTETGIAKSLGHASYGAVFADVNGDGRQDIFIPYYVSSGGRFFHLFLNDGMMRFHAVDQQLFFSSTDLSPTAVTAEDLNNDGAIDLYIHSQKVPPKLWLNDGTGTFRDVSASAGLTRVINHPEPINGIVAIADVNNDGWKDIFDGSTLWMNGPGLRFTEVSERVGIQFTGTPSFADIDGDGDLDLFIGSSRASLGKGDRAALFRNNLDDGRSVTVTLRGTTSTALGSGTIVRVRSGGRIIQSATSGAAGSQLVPGSSTIHLALPRDSIVSIEAQFPSGITRTVEQVRAGESVVIDEGSFAAGFLNARVRSIVRTWNVLESGEAFFHLLSLLLIAGAFILYSVRSKRTSVIVRWQYWSALLIVHATAVHWTAYEDPAVALMLSLFGTAVLGASGLIVWSAADRKRSERMISHYRIIETIGKGGMGTVHKAVDIETKNIVAVKVLGPEMLSDPENRRRLSAEGHVLASFSHPNIVRVFEVGESGERGYIAMEYLSGGTLRQRAERSPLTPAEVKVYALQVCAGLTEVHQRGIIHRDLKSGNLMLAEDGTLRIMDFGLSKSPLVTTMTSLGTVLGTLGYVAPEQVTGLDVDARTDIFSLGVILYELLTGTLPFTGENEIALIHSIFNTMPPPPSSLRAGLSPEWDTVVMKCLKKERNERYAIAAAVAAALMEIPDTRS